MGKNHDLLNRKLIIHIVYTESRNDVVKNTTSNAEFMCCYVYIRHCIQLYYAIFGQVLLGMLLAVKGSLSLTKPPPLPSTSQHQEKHIVLPLTPAISRLPALPLSSRQNQPSTKQHQQVYIIIQCHIFFIIWYYRYSGTSE